MVRMVPATSKMMLKASVMLMWVVMSEQSRLDMFDHDEIIASYGSEADRSLSPPQTFCGIIGALCH
eukprot:1920075-Rhodomonas_salina.5